MCGGRGFFTVNRWRKPYIFPSYLYVCNCWVVDIEAVKFHIAQYCVSHLHNVFAIADF